MGVFRGAVFVAAISAGERVTDMAQLYPQANEINDNTPGGHDPSGTVSEGRGLALFRFFEDRLEGFRCLF